MKIMVVIPKYIPDTYGGAEFEAKWLSEAFSNQGYEVVILTEKSNEKPRVSEENGVKIYRTIEEGRTAEPQAYYETLRIWVKEKPDVVHGHHVYPTGLWLYPLMKFSSTPVYLTSHAEDIRGESKWQNGIRAHPIKNKLVKKAAKTCKKLILCGSNLKQEARDMGLYQKDYVVINNAIDLEKSEYSEKEIDKTYTKFGLDPNKKQVFFLSRLVPKKGLDTLIEVIGKLDKKDMEFVIAGTGPLEAEIKQEKEQRGLDNLTITGRITESEKEILFQKSEIFLFPSYSEGFPIVILEAMKYGCAIVTSDLPGIRDALDETEAFFFPPGEIERLESYLMNLNDFKLEQISKKSQEKATDFDPEIVASKYLELFFQD